MTPLRLLNRLLVSAAVLALVACGAVDAPQTEAQATAETQDAVETWEADERSPAAGGANTEASRHQPGEFDYYLLALSWSPTYCAAPASAERDPLQCDGGRPFSFIVHGLWPQYERGWPEDCPTSEPTTVDDALVQDMLDLMPSPRLVEHQWDKHGACVGGSQEDYFAAVRAFRQRVSIPPAYARLDEPLTVTGAEVEQAFIAANRGLEADAIAVTCNRGRLREVRLCMTREGAFRSCGADVRDACGDRSVTMLPVRGG